MKFRIMAILVVVMGVFLILSGTASAQDTDTISDDLQEASPIELWQMLAGIVIPLVVGVIVRQGWTVQYKNAALFAVSVVVTTVGMYFAGTLDNVRDWVVVLMTIVITAYGSYQTLWQFLPLPQRIEAATGGDPLSAARYNKL